MKVLSSAWQLFSNIYLKHAAEWQGALRDRSVKFLCAKHEAQKQQLLTQAAPLPFKGLACRVHQSEGHARTVVDQEAWSCVCDLSSVVAVL